MIKTTNATLQGLITGGLMIAASLLIYQTKSSFDNNLQFIVYALYILGLAWTLHNFRIYSSKKKNFKQYFSHGFKCFVVVTLLMVAFTWAFMQLNPQMENEMAENTRREMMGSGNYTQAEIDSNVTKAKEYYTPMLISMAIFSYLLIGSVITAALSAILLNLPKNTADA
ncbi:MAG TPA: hypothetical protein DHV17_06730 [Chitinophagaceae bacterium]|nr:hypothetical protein [Chitinophagaceae bacterium]